MKRLWNCDDDSLGGVKLYIYLEDGRWSQSGTFSCTCLGEAFIVVLCC